MLRKRIIPALLLKDQSLVKTIKFNKFRYIGDPCNTVRIFNELEVDELLFMDITASIEKREPNFNLLKEISDECFMPLSYGGGIKNIEQAKKIFDIGFEKISINTSSLENPNLITELANFFGSQAVIASVDVRPNFFGAHKVYKNRGKKQTNLKALEWSKELESLGAGELLLTSVDREGTWEGFDTDLVSFISDNLAIPVIAHGGAGSIKDVEEIIQKTNVSAIALGSLVMFQKKDMGVLINFPSFNLGYL